MLPNPIENTQLGLSDIPASTSDWDTIQNFALTFNAFKIHGSFEKCAEIANNERHDTLTNLRTCLFFEQRRWQHFGDDPDEEAMVYIIYLLDKIRAAIDRLNANG